jgi:N-formylglutamate amidohydrolase
VLNGRFKGGWTTRHYGRPGDGMHAIQMELAQSTHLATRSRPSPTTSQAPAWNSSAAGITSRQFRIQLLTLQHWEANR